MERNREVRRGSISTTTNGVSRRRHRTSSFRDSPEEDVSVELQETARLRDRGSSKKDRDRSSRNKRRRGDRLMHGSIRDEGGGGEDSSEESVDDDEEEEDEDGGGGGAAAARMLPPNLASSSSAVVSNQLHRKSFPPAKIIRAASAWKVADEMIGVSVPRKARSASAKRLQDGCVAGELIHRQTSTSPGRSNFAACSPVSVSPSSSNASLKKKMKHMGAKQRPPRISKSSSVQDDIEIEVAEVLYGLMRQSHCPKQEISNLSQKPDSKDAVVGSSNDPKPRVSSPASLSPQMPFPSPALPQNSSSSTVLAPKRKRPRPVKNEEDNNSVVRNFPLSSVSSGKLEISSPKLEKNLGSAVENGEASAPMSSEVPQPELIKPDSNNIVLDAKPLIEESESRDMIVTEEESPSPKRESPSSARLDVDLEDAIAEKTITTSTKVESQREEKFKIDLMAPPSRSSPERDVVVVGFESDPKSTASDVEMKTENGAEEGHVEKICRDGGDVVGKEKKKEEMGVEDNRSHKLEVKKERTPDLQLDLEKHSKDTKKPLPPVETQQQEPNVTRNDLKREKNAQSTASVPLPMNLAGWPSGLPPLGYMPPMQAVMSMDGSTGSLGAVQPPHSLPSQSRPKKCATHFYIAQNIDNHQKFMRMNPFWPAAAAAAGPASFYGAKPYNLNVAQSTETSILGNPFQGSFPVRNSISLQDKGQATATLSGSTGKERSSVAGNFMDAAQRKQPRAPPPPAASNNLLHGPAFVFPMSQQQAGATAATTRSGAVKSAATTITNAASPSAAISAAGTPVSSSSTAAAAATMSCNYPNLPANEAQYLAILQNNGYPFPIPAHVGAPPSYRGGTPQGIPYFNGPFYSSQMIHPSQLHQQQQQPHSQPPLIQQSHQNPSTSSGSSSSQKHHPHPQQQQRLQGSGSTGAVGSSHSFPASKNSSLPAQQPPHRQHNLHNPPYQARQLDAEMGGGEDSPSTADSRVSHIHKSLYGQSFAMPFHPQNFALMNPAAALGGGNHGEKQQQQPQHHQGFKGGVELIPSQAFAMSFASYNGSATPPGIDFSSMAQNHAIFQSLPEDARHGYHMAAAAAAAQAAQQKKNQNHQISEEGKSGGGKSSNADDERKGMAGKVTTNVGHHTLAFSRPDTNDSSVSTILSNTVIDSSARNLNLISAPISGNRAPPRSVTSSTVTTTSAAAAIVNTPNSQQQQQIQLQKHQQQQMQQQQHLQQQLGAAASARSKTSTASMASIYTDRLPSSSMVAKFPNALSVFPHGLIQTSTPAQSPPWKNSSARTTTTTSQAPQALASSSTSSSLKNISQQQGSRTQQGQTQISFGVNSRSATPPQGQQQQQQLPSNNNQTSSSMAVESPPTSVSRSAGGGGSPRTASTNSKSGQTAPSSSPSPQAKGSSPSGPSSKSSPVGGRNVPSILSNAHVAAMSSVTKQQQQLQKQAQMFFSNAYMQAQSPQSSNTTAASNSPAPANSGYYHHHRRQSEQQQSPQQQQGSSTTSSTGMLSPSPALLTMAATSDPTKATANNTKGSRGGLPQTTLLHAAQFATPPTGNPHQLISAAFPYIHAIPTAVQVKPAEQKQPAGE